jgi:hypothetical protein
VRDLTRHQELEGILGSRVVRELDEPLVYDLRPGLRGDVAAKVDVELAGDLQVVRRPWIPLRVEQIDAATASDGNQRIGLRRVTVELQRLEVNYRSRIANRIKNTILR